MAAATNDSDELLAAINVTPFVDIVLVLLIILMVTSVQIVKASLEVDLPSAASGGDAVESTLNVVITKDGDMLVDGEPTTRAALIAHVRAEKARNPELRAVIAADRGVVYDRVIQVIDVVKSNGVKSFALNIQRANAPTVPDGSSAASATRFD
jgi:biopolymer transport protein TolR